MPDPLDSYLARWYTASIGHGTKDKVLADFAADEGVTALKAEAARRWRKPNDPVLNRDHVSRVANDFLERVK
jgi:hypothetical protein